MEEWSNRYTEHPIMHIRSLELTAANMALQHAFYTELLGLPAHLGTDQLRVTIGASQLIFTQAAAGIHQPYHLAFNIPPQQFAEAKEWLATRTSLAASADGSTVYHSESWNADSCYFFDADRNILELIARHSTMVAPTEETFSAKSLLEISEIGIVCDDVAAMVAQLQQQYGLAIYRESMSDQFAAVGDEHGLCIVVKRGRLWFAVHEMPAASAPLRVEMDVGSLVWQ
jgi:catechol-2,3-dioxygenase